MPNALETTNTVPGPGTDSILLPLTTTPPVWTSQTKSSQSTPPVESTIYSSYKLIKLSGALVTLIGIQGDTVTFWIIGFLFSQEQDDERIRDPHGCERSCSITGPDCVACEHEDFFHCPSTGFCINKDLVCDGHPHPSCGGDDEGVHHCYEIYYKKRTVVRYATLICHSVT